MSKIKPAAVERDLNSALFGYKDRASAVKAEHAAARKEIQNDTRRSDAAKKEDLAALAAATRNKLDVIQGEQQGFVKELRARVEADFRGFQSTDANAVLLRRDAADRARKIGDGVEAMDELNDAIANGDDSLAHAIGVRARNTGMVDVAEAYQAAFPSTAGSAEALNYIDEMTTGAAYNLANSITFSAPN